MIDACKAVVETWEYYSYAIGWSRESFIALLGSPLEARQHISGSTYTRY